MGASLSSPSNNGRKQKQCTVPLRSKSLFILGNPSITRCEDSQAPPPPPPPGATSSPPPPPDAPSDDSIQQAAAAASSYENPGSYEMATSEAKRFFQLDTFDGFRCDINKQMSPFMLAMHNFWVGTTMIPDGRTSSYAFVTQVADDHGFLMARIDPGQGSVNGRIHRAILNGAATGKLQMGLSSEGQNDSLVAELETGGTTWMGSARYGSMANGIILGCNYMQAITPRLHMGGDGMYIGMNGAFQTNYALKYTIPASTGDEDTPVPLATSKPNTSSAGGSSTICAVVTPMQGAVSLDYTRVVTPNRVTLASSLQCSVMDPSSSQVTVAAEFKLAKSSLNVAVEGTGQVSTILETRLGIDPSSPALNLSAYMDHRKEEYKFGYGIKFNG